MFSISFQQKSVILCFPVKERKTALTAINPTYYYVAVLLCVYGYTTLT